MGHLFFIGTAHFEGSQAFCEERSPRVDLAHVFGMRAKTERYTKGGEKEFHNDTMLQDAVIRNFEIIGEAAKRVPEAYCRAHSQDLMGLMAGFRDVLIHAYEGIDLKRIWRIVQHDCR